MTDNHSGERPAFKMKGRKKSPVGWKKGLVGAAKGFMKDNVMDLAAALTYYSVLSVFPAIIALVAVLGMAGTPETVNTILDIIRDVSPSSAVESFRGAIEGVVGQGGKAGLALILSTAIALWSASSYTGAFMRASNEIYKVEEDRRFWILRPLQLLVTLVSLILVALLVLLLVISGALSEAIGSAIGLGETAVATWNIVKWPIAVAVFAGILGLLYYASPSVVERRVRWISPGAIVAVLLWVVASVAFAFYVGNFGRYGATYGSLSGVVVFLLWLWITNLAMLFGQELNAHMFPAVENLEAAAVDETGQVKTTEADRDTGVMEIDGTRPEELKPITRK